jgi:hypothetical protein
MAPLITHLVIGERVFAHLTQFQPVDYGAFLLGCALVDVHAFSKVDRCTTHFAGRLVKDGADAFDKSCVNFLGQLDVLLVRPWSELTRAEWAFVAGYLCHLAADENWKQFDWHLLHTQGIYWWTDSPAPEGTQLMPAPADVLLTAFEVLSNELYIDFSTVASALNNASVPDVLTHVPHAVFQATWEIAQAHVMNGGSLESYLEMLGRLGKTGAEIQVVCRQHEIYWDAAMELIQNCFGGVELRIQAMVRRSLETVPLLL